MKHGKQDRRSPRTRGLITAAMTDLLREKRYGAITVQDVLDRAGIGRSTFYGHYFDKEDALLAVVEQQIDMMSEQLSRRDAEQGIVPSLELFQHAKEQYPFFRTMLVGHTEGRIWETARTLLSRNIERALVAACAGRGEPAVPLALVAEYLAGALGNLVIWWLEAGMPYAPEQMDRIFQQLALPGMWAAIEGTKR